MMNKYVFYAFNGNLMCFIHVLLNALDLESKGMKVKIVIEGEAVKLIKELEESGNMFYKNVKEKGLIDCICKACSAKMGVLEYNQATGLPVGGDMSGHPAMASYLEQGYQIITL
jgi:hypothetical protein